MTISEVSVAELADDAVLLDVREPDEFAAGHAVGAVNIPLDLLPVLLHDREAHAEMYELLRRHRPRGVLSLANHDANVLMQAGALPNVRADVTPLQPGMTLTAVNTFGGLAADKGRWLGKLSRLKPLPQRMWSLTAPTDAAASP